MSVYFNKKKQMWHVRIFRYGHNYHIGYYDDFDIATIDNEMWKDKPINELQQKRRNCKAIIDPETNKLIESDVFTTRDMFETNHPLEWFEKESRRQIKELSLKYQ